MKHPRRRLHMRYLQRFPRSGQLYFGVQSPSVQSQTRVGNKHSKCAVCRIVLRVDSTRRFVSWQNQYLPDMRQQHQIKMCTESISSASELDAVSRSQLKTRYTQQTLYWVQMLSNHWTGCRYLAIFVLGTDAWQSLYWVEILSNLCIGCRFLRQSPWRECRHVDKLCHGNNNSYSALIVLHRHGIHFKARTGLQETIAADW